MNIFDDDFDDGMNSDELSPGTELMLGQYRISRYLNSGGFGITYLAEDSLDRPVVIKECFPRSFCRRSNMLVQARSHENNGELRSIVRLFTHEARALSKLQHPFIVGVHQVFEDNNTAYMALDFVEGHDLLAVVEQKVLLLRPDQITAILQKTLDAIKCVHAGGLLHRDIAPDNIILTNELNPVLIDFGAAREQATKATRALSALRVVKDGYSPQEFYIAGSEQGPYSDLYSLAASFYHLITGELPPDSQVRIAAHVAGTPDPYIPLDLKTSDYSPEFCSAIDKAMAILPKDRMQSAEEWLVHLAQPRKSSKRVSLAKSKSKQRPVSRQIEVKAARNSVFSPRLGALLAGGTIAAGMAVAYPFLQPALSGSQGTETTQAVAVDVAEPTVAEERSVAELPVAETFETAEVVREDVTPISDVDQSVVAEVIPAADAENADVVTEAAQTFQPEVEAPVTVAVTAAEPEVIEAAVVAAVTSVAEEVSAEPAVLTDFVKSYADGKVAADWRVELPFEVDATATVSSVTEDAPAWLEVGMRLTEVNGVSVSTAQEMQTAIRDHAMKGNGEMASLALRAQTADGTDPVAGDVDAKIVYSAVVSDQYRFNTWQQDEAWLTTVVEVSKSSAAATDSTRLRPGDVVVALMDSDEQIRDGASVARIVGSEIEAGKSRLKFAVNRDGLMWIVDVDTNA